jgi:RNA polymerase sigma-70 factor, ECF subfamily
METMSESSSTEALLAAAPKLRAFALSLCRNGDQADDLVQDTLLKAWTNLASFEPGTNMLAWLCTILRNRFYSDCRSRRRALEPIDDFAEQIATRPTQMAQVEHEVLCVALAQLPARRREALITVGIAGFSYEENGEKMRMSGGHHQEQGQSRASGAR